MENTQTITVTFRHTEPTSAIKEYAQTKVEHVANKYLHQGYDIAIVLGIEKRDHFAEAIVRTKEYTATGKGITEDLYSAIDKVVDIIETQLRKHKEKISDHHPKTSPKELV